MRKKPPCFQNGGDCPNRKLLCHGMCKEFQAWKEEDQRQKKIRDEAKEREYITYSDRVKRGEIKKLKEGRR